MGYKIKEIFLDFSENFSRYHFEDDDRRIKNLSKINIFIGANNSGKSRFMRQLFSTPFPFIPSDFDFEALDDVIKKCRTSVEEKFSEWELIHYGGINANWFNLISNFSVSPDVEFLKPFLDGIEALIKAGPKNAPEFKGRGPMRVSNVDIAAYLNKLGVETKEKLQQIIPLDPNRSYSFQSVYIPALRGLRPIAYQKDGEDYNFIDGQNNYKWRTINDYFKVVNIPNGEIFTGLDLYEDVKKLLLGNLADREIIADYQNFLSEAFFDGDEVALIPSIDKDVLSIKIGDEEENPIYEVGDGIQAIIILTFPLFVNRGKNLLVYIEEPELFLHPGLQRTFIETILHEQFDDFQYFIATHSNHFLDITLDIDSISIYTFRKSLDNSTEREKPANFFVDNVDNEDTNTLDLIGVRNSSIFLSNCTIWVEGITDRFYLRKYLEIYQDSLSEDEPHFKEDTHFSFVEYSGGNITHWSFLEDAENEDEETYRAITVDKICNRLFLISDQDSGKEARHKKLAERLGDEGYYCLQAKEIENLLKPDIIKKVVAEYEKTDDSDLQFETELTEENYKNEYLGSFIDNTLKNKQRRGSYASDSGTISDKVNFCKKAVRHIEQMDDLSIEAVELCKKIYKFIAKNNFVNGLVEV